VLEKDADIKKDASVKRVKTKTRLFNSSITCPFMKNFNNKAATLAISNPLNNTVLLSSNAMFPQKNQEKNNGTRKTIKAMPIRSYESDILL
jgi:hypothetical protein